MPITVQVPDVGDVEFPDSMSQAQIVDAIERDILPKSKPASAPVSIEPAPSMRAAFGPPGSNSAGVVNQAPATLLEAEAKRIAPKTLTEAEVQKADIALDEAMAEPVGGALPESFKKGLAFGITKALEQNRVWGLLDPEFREGVAEGLVELEEGIRTVPGIVMGAGAMLPGSPGTVGKVILSAVMAKGFGESLAELDRSSAAGEKKASAKAALNSLVSGLGAAGLGRGAAKDVMTKPPAVPESVPITAEALKAQREALEPTQKVEIPERSAAASRVTRAGELPSEAASEAMASISQRLESARAAPAKAAIQMASDVQQVLEAGKEAPAKAAQESQARALTAIGRELETPKSETIGAAASVIPKRFFEDLKSAAIEWGAIGGHLPDEVKQLQREMESTIAAGDAAARMNTRDFMAAVKEEYGLNSLEMLGGGSRRIPAADVQLFNDYLKGQVPPSQIAPRILPVLDTMRAEMTGLSNKIATELQTQLNQLPVSSPKYEPLLDLIEKIRNNADVYMNRSYKFFDSNKKAPAWYDDLPLGTRLAAEDYLIQNLPTAVTRAEAQSSLLRWLSDLRGEPVSGGGSKVGAKDLSIFVRRKVIPQELRDVLGEYNNPMINYARSVEKMTRWVANNKFLNEVKQAGMGRFLFEEGMDPVGFNAQIAGDASNTMSPLNGLRTSQVIADAFRDIGDTPKHGAVMRGYLTLNAWTKFAATALSVMTQARNLSSRPFMAGMAGHWNLGELGKSVRSIYEDFAGSDKVWRSKLDEYYKLGVIGDTSRAGELRAILKDASIQDVSPSELYSWSMGRALKTSVMKVPGEIYRLSDELGNIFGFENERAIQRRINPTWTDAKVNKEAAKITRELYPTYSESPKALQSIRRNVLVGPFVNFPFQVFRTMWNGLIRSATEIRSANPIERAVGAKRLASQVATLGATYGLMEAGKQMLGISNQEEEDFRRFQPYWSKNSKWLFTGKEDGELTAVNLSYLDPYSYATDTTVAVMSGIKNGDSPFGVFSKVTKEMFRPFISEQMLANSIKEWNNGKTDEGREIYNPTDTDLEKASKGIRHVIDTAIMPGTIQRAKKRIIPAIKNEQPLYGRKLEVGPEIARELTGIAVEKFNFKNALAFKASEFSKLENSSEDVFRRTLSRTKTTTEADISDSYREANTRRLELWKGLRGDFMAALRSGVSKSEAESALKNRGVTKEVTEAIARGSYQPLEISSTMEDRAKERKRRIPISEIRSIQSEFRGMNLDE